LDSSGKATRRDQNGGVLLTWYLNSTVIDMSITSSSSRNYVGFNLGNSVLEYDAISGALINTYAPQYQTSFKKIQYATNYTYLYISTNSSNVDMYLCSSGKFYGYSFYLLDPVLQWGLRNDGSVIGLTVSNNLYKVTNYYSVYNQGSISTSAMSMGSCPNTHTVIVGESSSHNIKVYDDRGTLKQTLNYMTNTVSGVDCTDNYLGTVDSYGYVGINTYESTVVVDFPGWAIGLIVGGVFFVVAGIIVAIAIRVVKKRKMRQ
jgi:hypothetical protein